MHLKILSTFLLTISAAFSQNHYGWIRDASGLSRVEETSSRRFGWIVHDPLTGDDVSRPKWIGEMQSAGKRAFLWQYFPTGVQPSDQGDTPACVGFASAKGIDFLQAVQIHGFGTMPLPLTPASPDSIYAFARNEVAQKKLGYRGLPADGAMVSWAAQAINENGCLAQIDYGDYDLRAPGSSVSEWGRSGVPDNLELLAIRHRALIVFPVATTSEVREALYRGCPVVVGSPIGFRNQPSRDTNGFLEQNGQWMHAMLIIGFTERDAPFGFCILNSWGEDWVSGPNRFGAPNGSFWVKAEVIDAMIKDGELYAISAFTGFRECPVDWNLLR